MCGFLFWSAVDRSRSSLFFLLKRNRIRNHGKNEQTNKNNHISNSGCPRDASQANDVDFFLFEIGVWEISEHMIVVLCCLFWQSLTNGQYQSGRQSLGKLKSIRCGIVHWSSLAVTSLPHPPPSLEASICRHYPFVSSAVLTTNCTWRPL